MCDPAPMYGNVVDADFFLSLTDGEPWAMMLIWEDDHGAPIDIAGPDWTVAARLNLGDRARAIPCSKMPETGAFTAALSADDVGALPIGKLGRLVVTLSDPADQHFHFNIPLTRRQL